MNRISVKNLVLMKGKNAMILKGLNADFEPGKLNAIMGPNGSGKTTFLNILVGLSDKDVKTSGVILFDEEERTKKWHEDVAYVHQNAYLMENQTVREILQFSLDMRNNTENTNHILSDYSSIIEILNLEKILDSSADVISGGEKKRTMIASELILQRKILILDEPTSDLDSHLALNLLMLLKKVAKELNIYIIFTIHKPSDQMFRQFDNLLFIKDGKTVYNGEGSKLIEFLDERQIIKPAKWVATDFLFEVFYNKTHFREIEAIKARADAYVNEIEEDSKALMLGSNMVSKGEKEDVNFDFNIRKAFTLYKRFIKLSFRIPILKNSILGISILQLVLLAAIYSFTLFENSHIQRNNLGYVELDSNLRWNLFSYSVESGYSEDYERKLAQHITLPSEGNDPNINIPTENINNLTNSFLLTLSKKIIPKFLSHRLSSGFIMFSFPFFIFSFPSILDFLFNQIIQEVQKKLYSTSTLLLAFLFYTVSINLSLSILSLLFGIPTGALTSFDLCVFCIELIFVFPLITLLITSLTSKSRAKSDVNKSKILLQLSTNLLLLMPGFVPSILPYIRESEIGANFKRIIVYALKTVSILNPIHLIISFFQALRFDLLTETKSEALKTAFLKLFKGRLVIVPSEESLDSQFNTLTPLCYEDVLFYTRFIFKKNIFCRNNINHVIQLFNSVYFISDSIYFSKYYFLIGFGTLSFFLLTLAFIFYSMRFESRMTIKL